VVKVGDPDHLALPYARVMPVGLAYVENPGRVLIVGLGGGTIPSFLRKHYPDLTIDIVDIDPDVVDVAKRFFGFVEDARMRAHVADGRKFIEETKRPYDIIFLDAFGCDNVPFHLTTREFLAAVRRALAPGGIVVGNIWSSWSNPLHDRMVRTYQEVFEELTLYKVSGAGNEILVGLPRTGKIEKAAVAARAQAISRERRFPHDLGEAVRYGYRYLTDQRGPAAVLTDAERPPKKDPAR
jgi:spermidine synthase